MTRTDLACARLIVLTCILHTPPWAKLLFRFTIGCFSYGPNLRKVHFMSPIDFDMFEVKRCSCGYYIQGRSTNLIPIPLRRAIFVLRLNSNKRGPNDPQMTLRCSRSSIHVHTTCTYIPVTQTSVSFDLQ